MTELNSKIEQKLDYTFFLGRQDGLDQAINLVEGALKKGNLDVVLEELRLNLNTARALCKRYDPY